MCVRENTLNSDSVIFGVFIEVIKHESIVKLVKIKWLCIYLKLVDWFELSFEDNGRAVCLLGATTGAKRGSP